MSFGDWNEGDWLLTRSSSHVLSWMPSNLPTQSMRNAGGAVLCVSDVLGHSVYAGFIILPVSPRDHSLR